MLSGALILLGGSPGIGKSTLLLQMAAALVANKISCTYISGEEGIAQVRLRASRLAIANKLTVDQHSDLILKLDQLGVDKNSKEYKQLLNYNLSGVAPKITCPTLISHGVDDMVMRVEGAKQLYNEISSSEKILKLWDGDNGGAIHCNYDSWNTSIPFMFDWLEEQL